MKLRHSQNLKTKLTPILRSWLPILKCGTTEIVETLSEFTKENPFVEVNSALCVSLADSTQPQKSKPILRESRENRRYMSDKIEQLSIYEKSLSEVLEAQILPPLFPTEISQKIAFLIIDNLNEDGYFEGDSEQIAQSLRAESSVDCANIDKKMVEQIRARFSQIDPPGIAAKDARESMIFQLDDFDLDDEIYDLAYKIINDLGNHKAHSDNKNYQSAMKIIYKIRRRLPPAIDFFPKESQIVPEIFIHYTSEGRFEVGLNDIYPNIIIDERALKSQNIDVKDKIKEARDLVDSINMRKATLKKIGLMILEYQYDFFAGGEIKPLKLNDIAKDLGHSSSTISRAVANKYLECNRGIFPLKAFFSTAINEEVSNTSIKDFLLECVKNEDRLNPLSDVKIKAMIEEKFGAKIVRRTITKYRKQLNIESSSERKKLYEVGL